MKTTCAEEMIGCLRTVIGVYIAGNGWRCKDGHLATFEELFQWPDEMVISEIERTKEQRERELHIGACEGPMKNNCEKVAIDAAEREARR